MNFRLDPEEFGLDFFDASHPPSWALGPEQIFWEEHRERDPSVLNIAEK
jgi:hypothetical protein